MTFRVNGIKQKQTGTTPVVLVVKTDSELLVRKLLGKYNILVLSLNEYTQEAETFGDIRAKIKRGFDGLTVVSQGTALQDVCEHLLDIGLDILDINSFAQPLAADAIAKMLETAHSNVQAKQALEQKTVQSTKEQKKKIYDDPNLAHAKLVIEWIFGRMPGILAGAQGQMENKEMKYIDMLQGDLRKLRMGNNYEKIRDLGSEILRRMQNMEDLTIKRHPEQAQFVIRDSMLTNQDVEREEMKLLYTQQRKLLGAKVSLIADEYALFGNVALLRRFFQKDLWQVIISPTVRLYGLHDAALIVVGFLLSLGGSFVVYNLLRPTLENLNNLRFQLIKLGVLGLLLWIGTFWKKKNIKNLIVIYGLTALAYRLLVWLITTNFAI